MLIDRRKNLFPNPDIYKNRLLLEMKDKIIAFMEDMESNSAERVSDWFTNDSTLWIPPASPITGISRIRALFRALFRRYEYVHWNIVDILPINANRCIHICDSHGKMFGCDSYTNRVITDIVFNDEGKIISLSDYFKDTAIFEKKQVLIPEMAI